MNGMITVAKNSNNIDFINYSYSIGVRDYRFNMDYEKQAYEAIETVRSLNLEGVKLFADFQGIKMRLQLENGVNDLQYSVGDLIFIYTCNEAFPYISNYEIVKAYVRQGYTISFSDGKIEGVIRRICENGIWVEFTKVVYVLRQNAGCSISGKDMPSPRMNQKVCQTILKTKAIKDKMVDWVILSFVESADEIKYFIEEMHKQNIKVMAKIETVQGVENIESIGSIVDGFMIGRGDLKNTTKEEYHLYYSKALKSVSMFSSLYNGVGTFFLSSYSQTLELTNDQIADVINVKKYNFHYIMLSKEVVNSNYPYETIKKLQQLCQN